MPDKYDASFKGRYRRGKASAKKRNLEWALTLEEYESLVSSGLCHYCSSPIGTTGFSLDRMDNSKPYTVENCVSCCRHCNMIKGDSLSYKEAVVVISAIVAMRKVSDGKE